MAKEKNSKKNGFTLVELAIVIAIIAILAAVLIPTFSSVINSANESVDEQAVRNMNVALASDEALNGEPEDPKAAMLVIEEAGYKVDGYEAQSADNVLYYDWSENRVLIYSLATETVTYPAEMVEVYGTSTGVAASWYTLSNAYNTVYADADGNVTVSGVTKTVVSAITDAGANETLIIELKDDLTIDEALSNNNGANITVNLNRHTLSYTASVSTIISEGSVLYIKNGSIDTTISTIGAATAIFAAESNSSITLENVSVTSAQTVLYPRGDTAQVNVIDSVITTTGAYCVATNAATIDNYGVAIRIDNSTLTASSTFGSTAVLLNVEGTLSINNSIITGQLQGVFVRAGTATITNSTIASSQVSSVMGTDIKWSTGTAFGSGNAAAMGAVVVGDTSNSAYDADATVTVTNCILSADVTIDNDADTTYSEYAISLYIIDGDSTYDTSVTVSSCTIDNYIVNWGSSAELTYDGANTVYTSWNGATWE